MFTVGETVCYGTQGVCMVKELTVRQIGREKKEYYVLQPVYDERSAIYVPADNQALVNNIRRVLTEQEVNDIISSVVNEPAEWIDDDLERKEFCSYVVRSGDRRELMQLINMLYVHQEDLKTQKKHFHISDERYLKEAERLLHNEFAYVLKISPVEVAQYILSRIK